MVFVAVSLSSLFSPRLVCNNSGGYREVRPLDQYDIDSSDSLSLSLSLSLAPRLGTMRSNLALLNTMVANVVIAPLGLSCPCTGECV